MARRITAPTADEIPILPSFPSTNYDVKVHLTDGSVEVIPVLARGKAAAWMTALYTVQRWPEEKIAMLERMEH